MLEEGSEKAALGDTDLIFTPSRKKCEAREY